MRNYAKSMEQMQELKKAQEQKVKDLEKLNKDRSREIQVTVLDLSRTLCLVHNIFAGLTKRTLWEMIRGVKPEDKLNERISVIKGSIIKMLADNSKNGERLEAGVTPYYWQPDDIIKQLGGTK